ncbi:hypothetical protein J132_02365 [Termitomyces sp. J132]|nr:hypothetical protein H2248_002223 [Termitomyces sp. 'cryptogamus']KNZ81168.1 hypothetical protein J132_02365 [Termitomyces sp. J132]
MANSYLPPHEYLPVDIVGEIFAHVITEAGIIHIPHRLSNTLPWSLGQVCSSWREILHSVPHLWGTIRLTTSITRLRNGHLDRLNRILPYSLPALNIREDNDIDEAIRNLERSNYTLETSLLSRLHSLHITASSAALVELLSAIHSPIVLSELSLDMIEPVILDELQNIKLFAVTNNLTSLKLRTSPAITTTNVKAFLHLPAIHFDRLTHLDVKNLNDPHFSGLWDILSQCISLKNLSLSVNNSMIISPRPGPQFLPRLEALDLSSLYTVNCHLFPLKQLTALSLSYMGPQCMVDFLHQTVQLESLSLMSIRRYNKMDIADSVARLDSLRSLLLDTNSVYVLEFLNFPKLTTLSMKKGWMGVLSHGLPTPQVRDFIDRSGCIIESFWYESDVRGKDFRRYKRLRSLLDALPSLRDFSASDPSVLFIDDLLNEVKENILIPRVQTLRICVESPVLFADVVESRVKAELKEEGFIRLKTAFAYYPALYTEDHVQIVPQAALGKLEALNNTYGTNFRMVLR